ncbi:MAG: hypothetical protein EA381_10290 [Planctomycetaceae bacterium]|nr:MAG: hypothetical protein EA381_10290 [Planctomycetaceae bacterium]
MFDLSDQIYERLRPVTRGLRGVRFWWYSVPLASSAALIAWLAIEPVRSGSWAGGAAASLILAGVAVGWLIVIQIVRRSFRCEREVASLIERHFPTLQQRLLTAVELANEPAESRGGYLRRRVFDEAHDHSLTHRWTDAVPGTQVWLSRLMGLIAIALMFGSLVTLATTRPSSRASAAKLSPLPIGEVTIEPGDTEVERGESLIVSLRFDPRATLGEDVQLVCIAEDGSERRLPMQPTLADPVLSAFLPSVDQPLRYQVVSGRYESQPYRVDVFDYPELVRADAKLEYPSYTGLENKRVDDTVRVTAVEGTRVGWELNLNHPVESAVLVDESGERVALRVDPEAASRYFAEFELTTTKRWRLELVDLAGRENKFPPELVARALPNQPPDLKLVLGGDADVSPLEEYPVAVSVRDDFGIRRFGITYQLADAEPVEVVLGESIPRGQTARGDYLLDFESLDARADQLLTYHFWAEDFAPDGSTRLTQGDLRFAEVRPLEEIYREDQSPEAGLADRQNQQPGGEGNGQEAEELAELQKQIIHATWKLIRRESSSSPSAEFPGDLAAVAAAQQDALSQLNELAERVNDEQSVGFVETATTAMTDSAAALSLAGDELSTASLPGALRNQQVAYQALLGLRAREFQVSRSQESQSASASRSSSQQRRQQQLDQLELKNDENRYETESRASVEETLREGGEQREVIDRLRELAQRQEDINKQIAQLQSALELAQTEAEREEAQRQLKRLRDQEQDLLRDADELADRMQQAQQASATQPSGQPAGQPPQQAGEQGESAQEPSQAMRDAGERLEETRENIRRAGEALARQDAAEALAAGTRAERELDEMREELREQAAGNFNEAMRQIRSDARELDERQQEIARKMSEQAAPETPAAAGPGLRPEVPQSDLPAELREQQERLSGLMDQVQETVQQAESSEPLLAQTLYDAFRTAQQQKVERKLGDTAELLRRGLQPQADSLREEADREITELRERLDKAADAVLGDQTRALQRALGELEELQEQLDREIETATGRGRATDSGEPSAEESSGRPNAPSEGEPQPGQPGSETPGSASGQPGDSGQSGQPSQSGQPPDLLLPGQTEPTDRPTSQQGNQPSDAGQAGGGRGQRMTDQIAERLAEGGSQARGGGGFSAPLSGEGYREWSDRLRDVEQMIEDPQMRSEVTRIRERARQTRAELRRHSNQPEWDGVEEQIAKPLRELTREVAAELLRRSADRQAVVPIDRDPVPEKYSEAVRRYYESLGSGQ